MAAAAEDVVADVGRKLAQQPRPSKDFIVKSLRQAAKALSGLNQNPADSDSGYLKRKIRPLSESLVKHGLLQHKDKDVRMLVAICFCEIIRVLAPDPSLSDNIFMGTFELFVIMFKELADMASPYFSQRVGILVTVARLKCCLRLLDIDSEASSELILEIFRTFFNVIRIDHQQSLFRSMLSIMTLLLQEGEISPPLLDVILQNLRRKGKGPPSASHQLAVKLIQDCVEKVGPAVCRFLTSCILEKDSITSKLREAYHDIICEIFGCLPDMLLPVIPCITQELLTEQVDVRLKSVNLIGRLLVLSKGNIRDVHHQLFDDLLKRFSDKVAEVRISAIRAVKACYLANPSIDHQRILACFEGRLLDSDSRVRMEAVIAICDIARSDLRNFPCELLVRATDRLRDKTTSVREEAFNKLVEVYHHYCSMGHEGKMKHDAKYQQIPLKILMLCYDKTSKAFSLPKLELVLAMDLFPIDLPVEERIQHWISMYSFFTPAHEKAFNSILCLRRRFQTDMRAYLSLWKDEKQGDGSAEDGRANAVIKRMSLSFTDHDHAEECLQKLHKLKDHSIAEALRNLLDEADLHKALNLRDVFLRRIGDKHSSFTFLESLSQKCACRLFGSEHVYSIVDYIVSDEGWDSSRVPAINLLLAIITSFPSLLRGSESQFKELVLEGDSVLCIKLLQILAKAAPYISMSLSDVYPLLERWCLEGSCAQCKAAIFAISAFPGPSTHFAFMELCQKLLASLRNGQNIPAVLKSLSCIAHCSIATFEEQVEEISSCISEKILSVQLTDESSSSDENCKSDASFDCQVKIYGVKTLVKGFVVSKGVHEVQRIGHLLDMLSKLLRKGEFSEDSTRCEKDKAHFRLAAAKSFLRLSGRWDLHITAELFTSTIMIAKDPAAFVRKSFLNKVHLLLAKHAIPMRYACAFSLAASDCLKDLQDSSFNYLGEFIKEYSKAARIRQTSSTEARSMVDSPVYVVVFLLHVLAHDLSFPANDCFEDVNILFYRPLACILHSLLTAEYVDGDRDFVKKTFLYLVRIFRAVKKAEDAVNPQITPKLHLLADIGLTILDAIKPNGFNLAHAPGPVLLPSSLYKTCAPHILQEHKYQIGFDTYENFVRKLVEPYQPKLNQLTSSDASSRHKVQKGAAESNFSGNNVVESKARKQAESSTNRSINGSGMNEMETVTALVVSTNAGHTAVSPISPGHSSLPESITVAEKDERSSFAYSRAVASNDQLLVLHPVGSEVSEVESEVLSQENDLSLLNSGKEGRKRKLSCDFEILDLPKAKFRNSGRAKVSAVSLSQQSATSCDPGQQCSLDSLSETIVPLRVIAAAQPTSTSKGKVFLDRTNLLTVNHLKDHGPQRKESSAEGHKDSQKLSAVQLHVGNKSAIAFRTRRRKA